MRTVTGCIGILLLSATVASGDEELILGHDGKSDYVIVIPSRPTLVEQTAARELHEHLAEVTGAALPVVSEAETLAYEYARKPPKHIRPRHNVVIRLCSIRCSFVEPLAEGKHAANVAFRRDMEAWARISSQLLVWDYVTNFRNYLVPHPNFHVLAPNLRYFVKNGAIGIFEQGDSGCRVGHFVRLRAWYLSHLLWDPDADEKKLLEEFMNGYYGAAAPYLIEYVELISDAGRRTGFSLGCFRPDTRGWLILSDMNRAAKLFDKAAAAVAGDSVLAKRVRRERLPLDHVWLRRYDSLRREARRNGVEFLGPEDPEAALTEFREQLRKHNAGEYRQGRRVPEDFGSGFSFFLKDSGE